MVCTWPCACVFKCLKMYVLTFPSIAAAVKQPSSPHLAREKKSKWCIEKKRTFWRRESSSPNPSRSKQTCEPRFVYILMYSRAERRKEGKQAVTFNTTPEYTTHRRSQESKTHQFPQCSFTSQKPKGRSTQLPGCSSSPPPPNNGPLTGRPPQN